MAPFADQYSEPDEGDPEVPEHDAAEQHQVEDTQDVQEKPTAAPPSEASEADAIEQQQEVPLDDDYEEEL